MSLPIKDGTGSASQARVDVDNRLWTRGVTFGPLEDAAEEGDAGTFVSTFTTGATNIEVLSIQNDEQDLELHISRMQVSASVNGVWTLIETTSGTAAGTPLVYANPNLTSGTVHSHTSFGNASVTGSLAGNSLGIWSNLASSQLDIFFEGAIVLGNGDEIALSFSADGVVYVTMQGFWAVKPD